MAQPKRGRGHITFASLLLAKLLTLLQLQSPKLIKEDVQNSLELREAKQKLLFHKGAKT